jgi:hypothetical protein
LLFEAGKKRGPGCPGCLAAGPKEAAGRFLKRTAGAAPASLAGLALRLAALEQWPISVADLVAQERAHLCSLFPKLTEEELRARVDDYYREYLKETGPT